MAAELEEDSLGHLSVLVIGENAPDQLEKFQRMEYVWPIDSRHIVAQDIFAEAKREHARSRPKPVYVQDYFVQWAKSAYGVEMLMEGEEPDLKGLHRGGWFRLDRRGEVVEMYKRTIPNSHWDWFERTLDWLLLRPGASGWRASDFWRACEDVLDGYAGIARKDAVDIEAMRNIAGDDAAVRWDRGDPRWPSNPMLKLPRDEFIQLARDEAVIRYSFVVKDGELFDMAAPTRGDVDQSLAATKSRRDASNAKKNALLQSLPGETMLISVSVHA